MPACGSRKPHINAARRRWSADFGDDLAELPPLDRPRLVRIDLEVEMGLPACRRSPEPIGVGLVTSSYGGDSVLGTHRLRRRGAEVATVGTGDADPANRHYEAIGFGARDTVPGRLIISRLAARA